MLRLCLALAASAAALDLDTFFAEDVALDLLQAGRMGLDSLFDTRPCHRSKAESLSII